MIARTPTAQVSALTEIWCQLRGGQPGWMLEIARTGRQSRSPGMVKTGISR